MNSRRSDTSKLNYVLSTCFDLYNYRSIFHMLFLEKLYPSFFYPSCIQLILLFPTQIKNDLFIFISLFIMLSIFSVRENKLFSFDTEQISFIYIAGLKALHIYDVAFSLALWYTSK